MKKLQINEIRKVVIIACLLFIMLLINSNESYAVSTKEEIDRVRELIEEDVKKDMKKWHNTEYRYYISGCELYIDSETGESYLSTYGGSRKYSNNAESFKMEDIAVNMVKEYLNKYVEETTPDEERLIDYFISGYFPYTREENFEEGDDIECKISFFVCPASENTIWSKGNEKRYVGMYDSLINDYVIIEGYNIQEYYLHLVYEDGKYVVKYYDTKPEGYDEFVERMKNHGIDLENMDYAKLINAKSEKEIIADVAETHNFENSNISVEKVNAVIVVGFSSLILVTLFMYLRALKAKIKK